MVLEAAVIKVAAADIKVAAAVIKVVSGGEVVIKVVSAGEAVIKVEEASGVAISRAAEVSNKVGEDMEVAVMGLVDIHKVAVDLVEAQLTPQVNDKTTSFTAFDANQFSLPSQHQLSLCRLEVASVGLVAINTDKVEVAMAEAVVAMANNLVLCYANEIEVC